MLRLVHEIQQSQPPFPDVVNPGRDLAYMPSFSWQYMGRNMRPLMQALCWVLAAMTPRLHEATPWLHPRTGWDCPPGSEVHDDGNSAGNERGVAEQGQPQERPTTSKTESNGKTIISIGLVMERRDNHSPHRLIQGVVEGIDRSRFRVVVFARNYPDAYPAAGRAVLEAADEVFILPWHPFAAGIPDPFAERKIVAVAQACTLIVSFGPYVSVAVIPNVCSHH